MTADVLSITIFLRTQNINKIKIISYAWQNVKNGYYGPLLQIYLSAIYSKFKISVCCFVFITTYITRITEKVR